MKPITRACTPACSASTEDLHLRKPQRQCLHGGLAPAPKTAQQAPCSASARTCTPTKHQQQRQCLVRGLAPKTKHQDRLSSLPTKRPHKIPDLEKRSTSIPRSRKHATHRGQSEALSAKARKTKYPWWQQLLYHDHRSQVSSNCPKPSLREKALASTKAHCSNHIGKGTCSCGDIQVKL